MHPLPPRAAPAPLVAQVPCTPPSQSCPAPLVAQVPCTPSLSALPRPRPCLPPHTCIWKSTSLGSSSGTCAVGGVVLPRSSSWMRLPSPTVRKRGSSWLPGCGAGAKVMATCRGVRGNRGLPLQKGGIARGAEGGGSEGRAGRTWHASARTLGCARMSSDEAMPRHPHVRPPPTHPGNPHHTLPPPQTPPSSAARCMSAARTACCR
jgi:hypothetical protein